MYWLNLTKTSMKSFIQFILNHSSSITWMIFQELTSSFAYVINAVCDVYLTVLMVWMASIKLATQWREPKASRNASLFPVASQFSSVAQSCPALLRPHEPQHARPPCPSPTPGVYYPNSYPLSWWCHPTISSSVAPFSCFQSLSASGAFPVSQFFSSGSQCIGPSASVLPKTIQGWLHLGLAGLISLLSKGFSRVFSSTTVTKHQFFSVHPSLWSNSHIHTWLLEKALLLLLLSRFSHVQLCATP